MISPYEREAEGDLNTVVNLTLEAEIVVMKPQAKGWKR